MALVGQWTDTPLCEGTIVPTTSGNSIEDTFCVVTKVCTSCVLYHGFAACICCFSLARPREKQKIIFLYFLLIQVDRAYE